MTTVTLPTGDRIWFRKLGSGAPLLQIHGSAFGHRNFEKMTPLMQPHFEVIDFDLPGYDARSDDRVEAAGKTVEGGTAGRGDVIGFAQCGLRGALAILGDLADQLAGGDMGAALVGYRKIAEIVGSWQRRDVEMVVVCAQAIILDEGQPVEACCWFCGR